MHCKLSRQVSQVIIAKIQRPQLRLDQRGKQSVARLQHWLRLLTLCLPLLTVQCAASQQSEAAALPLDDALPASWIALRDVQEVNIDGDGAAEYLLFFVYDSTAGAAPSSWFFSGTNTPRGPIGAVIYDTQVITGTTNAVRVSPDKPTNAFVPYALLPSYRRDAGQGFMANPEQAAGVQAYPVSYRSLTQATSTAVDTLIFLAGGVGDETYLTFAWWQNRTDGYGVTQLYAPGGFEETIHTAFDWSQWQNAPRPIPQIIAVHPLHDRNLLCRRFRYDLESAATPIASSIHYQQTDLGLHFCTNTPPHPFYPEGVVLAYLLEGSAALLDATVAAAIGAASDTAASPAAQEAGIGWVQQLVQNDEVVRVDDLASYATLATTTTPVAAGPPDTIAVCAALTIQTPPSATEANTMTKQVGLLFTLRHQPAGFQPPTPDQLFILTVETIAAPNDGNRIKCEELLGG